MEYNELQRKIEDLEQRVGRLEEIIAQLQAEREYGVMLRAEYLLAD